jgi:hypothetical protein
MTHRKKLTAKKPCKTRENKASPHPLARDVDLNPEKYNLEREEKIHFPRVFEVFSEGPSKAWNPCRKRFP